MWCYMSGHAPMDASDATYVTSAVFDDFKGLDYFGQKFLVLYPHIYNGQRELSVSVDSRFLPERIRNLVVSKQFGPSIPYVVSPYYSMPMQMPSFPFTYAWNPPPFAVAYEPADQEAENNHEPLEDPALMSKEISVTLEPRKEQDAQKEKEKDLEAMRAISPRPVTVLYPEHKKFDVLTILPAPAKRVEYVKEREEGEIDHDFLYNLSIKKPESDIKVTIDYSIIDTDHWLKSKSRMQTNRCFICAQPHHRSSLCFFFKNKICELHTRNMCLYDRFGLAPLCWGAHGPSQLRRNFTVL